MPERRPEDYDRDFADLVSGMEFDPDPPDSTPPPPAEPGPEPKPRLRRKRRAEPEPEAGSGPDWFNLGESFERAEVDEPDPSEWKPERPAMPRLRTPALVALGLLGYCVLILILAVIGLRPPIWVAWSAVAAFVAAMLVGWRALPRHRDPDDGDGAVL